MSESDQRGKVTSALKSLHGFAVENPALPGTPDVSYIGGWIELKWLPSWPKRETTNVAIEHYTVQQRNFHRIHWAHGGACHLLLQVRNEWFLFDGPTAADHVGLVPRAKLNELCLVRWDSAAAMRKGLIKALQESAP